MFKRGKKLRIQHPITHGGPGSGNFGHAGRPGAVGGSGGGGLTAFHGTSSDYVDLIKEHGLIPGKSQGGDSWAAKQGWNDCISEIGNQKVSVYMTDKLRVADQYARYAAEMSGGVPVILEVSVPRSFIEKISKDEKDSDAVKFNGRIKPDWITRIVSQSEVNPPIEGSSIAIRKTKKMISLSQDQSKIFYLVAIVDNNQTITTQSTLKLVPSINIHARINRADPTKTLVLRNNFVAQMNARFRKLKKIIQKAVVDDDCFGLANPGLDYKRIVVQADLSTRGGRAFDFPTSQEKSAAFLEWLRTQEENSIIETVRIPQIGTGIDSAWTDIFIKDSYQRGVQRARDELLRGKYAVPSMEVTGGISASMLQPMHIDRVGVAYSRTYDGLKGISHQMDMQISHVLAKGLADGDSQKTIAKKLLATIDGNNAGTLGITDSLGRFIPAERRAAMLARTEVIRAHAQGTLQEYKNWGVAGVNVLAEFTTAGYKVCPICQNLAAKGPYTLEQAANMIPAHPNCRCCWIARPIDGKVQTPVEVAPEGVGGIEQDTMQELWAGTASDDLERAVIMDSRGELSDIVKGEYGSTDFPRYPGIDIEGTGLHVIHTHPLNEPLSYRDLEAFRNKGISQVTAVLPNGTVQSAKIITKDRGLLYDRVNQLYLDSKTGLLDKFIEGTITTKSEYNALLIKETNAIAKKLEQENLIKLSVTKLPISPAAGVAEWASRDLIESRQYLRDKGMLNVSLNGIHPDHFAPIINTLETLVKDYNLDWNKIAVSTSQLSSHNESWAAVHAFHVKISEERYLELKAIGTKGLDIGGAKGGGKTYWWTAPDVQTITFSTQKGVRNKYGFGWDESKFLERYGKGNTGFTVMIKGENPSITITTHEFGHILLNTYKKQELSGWETFYNSKPKSWWRSNVSEYAAANPGEGFAESLVLWRNRDKQLVWGPKIFPKEITKFFEDFDKLLKRKSITAQSEPQVNYHVITTHGGPGSGNFGHAGRPGAVGGSGGGGGEITLPSKINSEAELTWKQRSLLEDLVGKNIEYHLSVSSNLKPGKLFSEFPSTDKKGERGGEGFIYTTRTPHLWESQLAYEGAGESPKNIYLVEVKNPSSMKGFYGHESVSPPQEVKIIEKIGRLSKTKSLSMESMEGYRWKEIIKRYNEGYK